MRKSRIRPISKKRRTRVGAKWEKVAPGVWRIPDTHHPRGYRERRSPEYMEMLTRQKWLEQSGLCGICETSMRVYEAVPDHIRPRGAGGAWRDDHPDNIQAVHSVCNGIKGSRHI